MPWANHYRYTAGEHWLPVPNNRALEMSNGDSTCVTVESCGECTQCPCILQAVLLGMMMIAEENLTACLFVYLGRTLE